MAITPIESQQSAFKRGDGGGPEAFTTVCGVISFTFPDGSAAEIDTTDLCSVAKGKMMGLPDEGQVSLELNYDPTDAQHTGLQDDRKNRTKRNFQVVLTDASSTTFAFSGYVLSFSISTAVDDIVKASCTITIDGEITRTP